ncbi:MAG: gamma-glutamyltransferase [Gammaproteobacteria bacterium]
MIRRLAPLSISVLVALAIIAAAPSPADARESAGEPIIRYDAIHHPVVDALGMVATQNALATAVGARILAEGGNAVDAAVAVGFALAVVLPRAGNLGGGGFMMVHMAGEERTIAIDYREMAPAAAGRDIFLDADGSVDKDASRYSHRASGVPGTVAGLHHALARYGTMPWAAVIAPAVELAREGFVVSHDMNWSLERSRQRLILNPATAHAYYKPDGTTWQPGEHFRQPDLAASLELIAGEGPEAFYQGEIAQKIAREMEANGGLITIEDLAGYRVVERAPVTGEYRGYRIALMPPPSSGGVHIVQMLNVLEEFPVAQMGYGSADALHLLAEVMRRAYADRSKHLGDPDFYDVPVDWLTGDAYAKRLAAQIDMTEATPSTEIRPGTVPAPESPDTTHYSVMDAEGNVVANTYTLNFSYGSGVTIPGTGILMNNEMDDFSAKPGVPNAFGLLGGEANAVGAGKRPLSSMTPALLFRDGVPVLATGTPGGSRIITTVLQQLVNIIDHGMGIADATHAPRIHHQWMPDVLGIEPGFSPDTLALLRARGHELAEARWSMGSLQSVLYRDGYFYGVSDPRRPDAASMGPTLVRCLDTGQICPH